MAPRFVVLKFEDERRESDPLAVHCRGRSGADR